MVLQQPLHDTVGLGGRQISSTFFIGAVLHFLSVFLVYVPFPTITMVFGQNGLYIGEASRSALALFMHLGWPHGLTREVVVSWGLGFEFCADGLQWSR